MSHNYDQALENYEALVEAYPADRAGHANLAYTYLNVHDFDKAVVEGGKAIQLEPPSSGGSRTSLHRERESAEPS